MLLNKNCGCEMNTPFQTSGPRNDIFADIDIEQKYIKNEGIMPGASMKGDGCGCGCHKGMDPMMNMGMGMGCKMQPVYEQPVEKCVHKTFVHNVPHICPVNTKVINHHIYRHTYSPCYTCCEENQVCQVNEGSCCCFR